MEYSTDVKMQEPLLLAIQANDVDEVKLHLQSCTHISLAWPEAIIQGTTNIVQAFLEHGINVNERDPRGCTALLNALDSGQYHLVVLLLCHGASANVEDNLGRTPLMALYRTLERYRGKTDDCHGGILEHEALPLHKHMAKVFGTIRNWIMRPFIARMIRRVGGEGYDNDPEQRQKGATNRLWAVLPCAKWPTAGDKLALEAIALGANVRAQNYYGSILKLAAQSGTTLVLREIIAQGVDPSPILHYVAEQGVPSILTTILDASVDVDLLDGIGRTPLMSAVEGLNPHNVHTLLKRGANVQARSGNGRTALNYLIDREARIQPQDLPYLRRSHLFYYFFWPSTRDFGHIHNDYDLIRILLTQAGAKNNF